MLFLRTKTTLTGRLRMRRGWYAPVLQVQVQHQQYGTTPPPPGRSPQQWRERMKHGEPWTTWRDATQCDVDTLSDAARCTVLRFAEDRAEPSAEASPPCSCHGRLTTGPVVRMTVADWARMSQPGDVGPSGDPRHGYGTSAKNR